MKELLQQQEEQKRVEEEARSRIIEDITAEERKAENISSQRIKDLEAAFRKAEVKHFMIVYYSHNFPLALSFTSCEVQKEYCSFCLMQRISHILFFYLSRDYIQSIFS